MIAPKAYVEFLEDLEELIQRSRSLQLFRTRSKLNRAARQARTEIPDVIPTNIPEVKFIIGPVSDIRD